MRKVKSILLVDDDFVNNFMTQRLIFKLDVSSHIKVVTNGEEALNYISQFCPTGHVCCPDLIFLDINMPVMDGFEFLKHFSKVNTCNKKIRIVILATTHSDKDVKRMKEFGITDFMDKPLTEEKVLAYIEEVNSGLIKS